MTDQTKEDKQPASEYDGAIMEDYKIRMVVEDFVNNAVTDWRGHLGNGRYSGRYVKGHKYYRPLSESFFISYNLNPEQRVLANAIKDGKTLDHFVVFTVGGLCDCSCCGEEIILETDGKIVRPTTDCSHPDGVVTEFELNVPSGKIVAANDLREFFDIEVDHDVNTGMGCHKTTLAMAEIGCAHAYVGNSCPGIFKVRGEDSKFVITTGAFVDPPPDLGEDETYDNYLEYDGERVASICTDLWWYSLVDYDEFIRRGGKIDDHYHDLIDVKPGVYRFRHYFYDLTKRAPDGSEKRGEVVPFSEFEWVRDP